MCHMYGRSSGEQPLSSANLAAGQAGFLEGPHDAARVTGVHPLGGPSVSRMSTGLRRQR